MSYDDYEAAHMKVLSREGAKPASPDDKLQFALDILRDMFSYLDMNGDGVTLSMSGAPTTTAWEWTLPTLEPPSMRWTQILTIR